MIEITHRPVPSRLQMQLEQQGLPPLLARLYAARGITQKAELDYELKALLPPQALKGTHEAGQLLADALEADARLLIVADYDCDGATACALGIRALKLLAPNCHVDYLVPDRFSLGYGLSPAIVDLAALKNPDLIITVDNGIASLEGVARAGELGIATLITDHHLPGDTLPAADCIVNPNQPDCSFPSKNLAGVGVMFYVMLALRAELRQRGWFTEHPEPNLANLLDLVALGTVADVVKLDQNNRVLVSQGLKRIREGRLCEGSKAILKAAGRELRQLSTFDLGFVLAPRLNAAGRLSDMSIGIECLLTDDPGKALALAQKLDQLNRERREIEADMQEQALSLVESMEIDATTAGVTLFEPDWHQGVIGILASRIKDKLHRPVFAFARGENGELKGSGRSIAGLHLRDTLDIISKRAPTLLIRFGGHAAAAGLTLLEKDLPQFREQFAQVASELLAPQDLNRSLETDGPLESAYQTLAMAHLLESQIWGHGFPPPLFENEFFVEQQRILKGKHLKLKLSNGQHTIEGIKFNFADPLGNKARVTYRLGINEYNGRQSAQLMIEHLESL